MAWLLANLKTIFFKTLFCGMEGPVRLAYRAAYVCGLLGLSSRTAKLFLRLPVEFGGAGCPWLTVRADLRHLHQIMKLPFGRSALGALAGEELWNSGTLGHDVEVTKLLLSAYGIGVVLEGEEKRPIPRVSLAGTGGWILVSDGGLRNNRGGIGFVVARGEEILAVRSMGIRVHAGNSRAMEWLAKAAMLLMTQELSVDRL